MENKRQIKSNMSRSVNIIMFILAILNAFLLSLKEIRQCKKNKKRKTLIECSKNNILFFL